LLFKPELLTPVLEKLNQLFKLLMALLKSGFSLEPGKLIQVYGGLDDIIDPSNPYPVLLFLTAALLVLQYAGTRFKITGELTALSRILGAILGAVNANIVISLVKEFIRRNTEVQVARVTAQEAVAVQAQMQSVRALAPSGIAVALKDAPIGFLPESYWIWIGAAVVAVAVLLLISHFTNQNIGAR